MTDGLEEFQQQWGGRVLPSCLVLALWSLCWRYHKPEDENIQHMVMDIDIISCLRRTERPCKICPLSITLKATSLCENFEIRPVDCWYSLIEIRVGCSSDPHLRSQTLHNMLSSGRCVVVSLSRQGLLILEGARLYWVCEILTEWTLLAKLLTSQPRLSPVQ